MLISFGAAASDGVLEINQACAANTGCFAGDTAGFPVTIDGSAGSSSYQLTGDLDLSALPSGTTAISVDASYVTVDLNGFSIVGPSVCSGAGSTLSCSPSLTTDAGSGVVVSSGQRAIVVRNGTIRGMSSAAIRGTAIEVTAEKIRAFRNGGGGVLLQAVSVIRDVMAAQNANNGLDVDDGSLVEDCITEGNLNNGLEIDGEAIVENVMARVNGERGFWANGGAPITIRGSFASGNEAAGYDLGTGTRYIGNRSIDNGQSDTCGGGLCTERLRYYVTTTEWANGVVPTCDAGFRAITAAEVRTGILVNFQYDAGRSSARPLEEVTPPAGPYVRVPDLRGQATASLIAIGQTSSNSLATCSGSITGSDLFCAFDGFDTLQLTPGWKDNHNAGFDNIDMPTLCVELEGENLPIIPPG